MNCPACFNELTNMKAAGIELDVCQGGCGGIWFDAFELQRVEKMPDFTEGFLHIERDPMVQVDMTRKRECPACGQIKLLRHFFSAQRRVEVDHCPNCGGYWLDSGELDRIHAELSEAAPEKLSQIPMAVIRRLYRQRMEGPVE